MTSDARELAEALRAQSISLDTFLMQARSAGVDRVRAAQLARDAAAWPVTGGAGAARRGGTLRVGLWIAPEGMDPALATTRTSRLITEQLYSTLTALDADGRPYPDLAEWIEIDDDARTYTFGIRQGVSFTDGSPVTAEDVAFSLNRLLELGEGYHFQPWTVTMAGADVIDRATVRLRLTQPTGPILTWLAFCGSGIVSKAAIERGVDFNRAPVGSGPFRLEAWGETVRLVRHDQGDRVPHLDHLEFITIEDDHQRSQALLDGQIDLDALMAPAEWDAVAQSPAHVAMATGDGRWHWLMVNCADPLLGDRRVRHAISLGINRLELAGAFGRHAHPLAGVIAPWSWAHDPNLIGDPPAGDPAAARALLAAAGVAEGTPLTVAASAGLAIGRRQAQLVAAQLRGIGLDATVEELSAADWATSVTRGGSFQLATSYWGSPINDPDDFAYMGFRSGARYDTGTCGSPALDEFLEGGRASVDQAERTTLYRALEAGLVEELPVIPTIQPDVLRGVASRLRGFVPLRNAQLRSLREAWLEA